MELRGSFGDPCGELIELRGHFVSLNTKTGMNIENHKSRFLRISSRDRAKGTPTDFTVYVKSNFLSQVAGVAVKWVSFPNLFDNVQGFSMDMVVDGMSYTLVIPDGYYTIDTLIVAVQDEFLALTGQTLTITQDPVSGILSFTTTAGSATLDPNDFLGITAQISLPATAQSQPDLYGPTHCVVNSRQLSQTTGMITGDLAREYLPVLATVPIRECWGNVQHYETRDALLDSHRYYPYKNISEIDIKLEDEDGSQLSLGDNFHIDMILKIWYI